MNRRLEEGARELGIPLDESQIGAFDLLTALLLEWNEKLNLTRVTDPDEIALKHHLDSLSLLAFVEIPQGSTLIDIGTGAGFPGIPLKIARPDLRITMVDSVRKKLAFVESAVTELGLANLECVHGRAEDLGRDRAYRARFDFVVSRAVARLNVLAELCMPFCRKGGTFVAYKGPDASEEIREAERAIGVFGGEVEAVHEFALPGSDIRRTLVVVAKTSSTPRAYPRKPGTPERSPL